MKSFLKMFLILFVVFSMIISTAMYFYFKNDVEEASENNETKVTDEFEDLDISNYILSTLIIKLHSKMFWVKREVNRSHYGNF